MRYRDKICQDEQTNKTKGALLPMHLFTNPAA